VGYPSVSNTRKRLSGTLPAALINESLRGNGELWTLGGIARLTQSITRVVDQRRQTVDAVVWQFEPDIIRAIDVKIEFEFGFKETVGHTPTPLEVACQGLALGRQCRATILFVIDEIAGTELFDHFGDAGTTHVETCRERAGGDAIATGQRTPEQATEILPASPRDRMVAKRYVVGEFASASHDEPPVVTPPMTYVELR
jgi:hypothetical protein